MIQMEFLNFSEVNMILKNDYIYFHSKEGYPSENEMDFSFFYLVTDAQTDKFSAISFGNGETAEIKLSSLNNRTWVFRLPPYILNKLK